ncbi:hypothetical protein QTI24_26620 [Variovorax sp. J22P240]|uniref:hypothetical protein n=1 Tax=Variovorax sp. J22P240 TaxID=3053514 RepID=UPI0025771642|nr:hypothetical protein [Variovorax sp. J22P240]MDM0002207.1 hypothetical protein [Variovorax sp. J22P240]
MDVVINENDWAFSDYTNHRCTLAEVGTPKPPDRQFAQRLAQAHAPAAINKLVKLLDSEDGAVAIKAAQVLLDRGFGRPDQTVHQDNTNSVIVEMPWITAQRLAYRLENRVAEDIVENSPAELERLRMDKKGS